MNRINVDSKQSSKLIELRDLLWKWNKAHNLFSRRFQIQDLEDRLLECLAFDSFLPKGIQVADLGSGAGLPGLPLAVVRPDLQFTLVEPRAKRCTWLRYAAQQLKLSIEVVEGRWDPEWAHFDRVISRAVFPPEDFMAQVGKLAHVSLQMTGPKPGPHPQRIPYQIYLHETAKGSILAGSQAEFRRSRPDGEHHRNSQPKGRSWEDDDGGESRR